MPVGRKPRPTALKVIEGPRGHRPLPQNEPRFSPGIRRAPNHLSETAKLHWRQISKLLGDVGLLTPADTAALELLCEALDRYQEAAEGIRRKGVVIKDPKTGFPVQNPYLKVANEAFTQVRQLLLEFGMTPSARARVQTVNRDADKDKDPSARFFK